MEGLTFVKIMNKEGEFHSLTFVKIINTEGEPQGVKRMV